MADEQTIGIKALVAELKSGNAERRIEEAAKLQRDKLQLEKMEEQLKETGIEAKDSQKYRDEELRIKKAELALRKQGATSKAAREEIAKEESELQSNRFEKFFGENSFVGKSLGGLGDKLGNLVPGGAKGILGTLGTVAALGALVTFLQSETWKNLKDKIIPKLAEGLESFKNMFGEFVTDITTFLEDPSFANFTEIFTGESGGFLKNLAIITALLNPLKSLKLLRLGVTGLIGGVKMFSRGLNKVSSKIGGGPIDKQGRRLTKNKAGKMVVAPGQKGAGKFAKAIPKTAFLKGLGKGLLAGSKFIPGVGLAITAAVGIYDGMTAGIKEYKKSGDLGKSVEAGLAGAASGLTFGLVSQETFQKGIDGIQAGATKAWETYKSAWVGIYTGIKTFINDPVGTLSNIKAKITTSVSDAATKVSNKFTELTGIEVPSLDEIKTSITTLGTNIKTKFEGITGITLPTFADVKTKLTEMKTSFENVTGVKIPSFTELKTKFTNLGESIKNITFADVKTKITEFGTTIKNIELPTFAEVKTKFTELGTKLSELKLPSFDDIKTKFSDVATKIKTMKVPSFDDVGTALTKFRTDAEGLTGIKLPTFTGIKDLIEEKFSFKFSDLKLPEIPDFGALFLDVIRRIIAPIVNFTMPGLFGFGDSQPLRFALGKMGGVGESLLSFVDQTGEFAAPPPQKPAMGMAPGAAGARAGQAGINVIMGGTTTNNSGTILSTNRDITPDPFIMGLLNSP